MELDDATKLIQAGKIFYAINFLKDFVLNNEDKINTNEKVCAEMVKLMKTFPSLNESWGVFVGTIDKDEAMRIVEVLRLCLK
ncbi:hypothetical protein [Sulfuracidifex metallicus]|jgi:hypothetical protein|uniref:Uncharacterized protein n=1 Tax=Sulfuracidifex metallicus DSM 6482 = JCM 9184 TaxID=523847 RepID=A0A6A9QL84_SULME|nr:hypothetical protein [Sulfuracidifex metallicus]MUN28448.1 hypothetical protein [Sulfuracidifex metallicus DSM 6482 = JCM 9184]WOE51036.1 hypothetical protein RQ359_000275 [Sulfuracidifex metallicus DSM 6482 = JCM 9184]